MSDKKTQTQLQGFAPADFAVAEQVKASSCLKALDTPLFIRKVAERINARGTKVTPYHVMSVIRDAAAYGIDPASKDIYAFLQRSGGEDVLTFGITIEGWARILDARGCSWKFKTLNRGEINGHVFPTELECIIKKPNGTSCSWVVSWEEANTGSKNWREAPLHMMQVRALARCARVACGMGAVYSVDEAKAFWESSPKSEHKPAVQAEVVQEETAEPDVTAALEAMNNAHSRDELRSVFLQLPPILRANQEIRQASIKLANELPAHPQPAEPALQETVKEEVKTEEK